MKTISTLKSEKQSFEIIDITKFVLAFFVVAIHTQPLEGCGIDIINNVYGFIVLCAVPIFFMSSGYLLMNRINKMPIDNLNENINSVLLKYLKKIIKLYLIWTVVYLPITVYHYISEGITLKESVIDFVKGFVFIGEHYNSWILWYLLSTIYAIVFVLILNKLKLNVNVITIIGFVIFVGGCFIGAFVSYNGNLPNALVIVQKIISNTIVNGRLFRGFLYIPLGMLLASKNVSRLLSSAIAVIGLAVGIIGEYSFKTLSEIAIAFFSFGVFSLLITIRLKPSDIYFKLRKMSTVIYFIHMYIFSIFEIFIWHEKRFGFISFIIVALISLIISLAYVEIKYKKSIIKT